MAFSAPSATCSRPHVLAIPIPAQGHITPFTRFCTMLASQHGFTVTLVNVDTLQNRMADSQRSPRSNTKSDDGAAPRPAADVDDGHKTTEEAAGPLPGLRRENISLPGLDMSNDFRMSLDQFFKALDAGVEDATEKLVQRLSDEGTPVTCLITDVLLSSATQRIAEKFGIPRIAMLCSSLSINLLRFYFANGKLSLDDAIVSAISKRDTAPMDAFSDNNDPASGLPAVIRNRDLPTYKHVEDNTEFTSRFYNRECQVAFGKAQGIVVNSFEELEGPAFKAFAEQWIKGPVYGVGPLMDLQQQSASLWKEEDDCLQWLDLQPPKSVLYISFGSVTVLSKSQFEEILHGLQASGHRFLWALRPDLVEGSPASIPDQFLSHTKGQGLAYVVRWAPQLRVLSHPSVAGFLTHCGWNSTVEAVVCGVPMLCWPYFTDQFYDTKYIVEEWKVGLRFEQSVVGGRAAEIGRDEVERVVRELMTMEADHELRQNVVRLQEAARSSLQAGGSSHSSIRALCNYLCSIQHH